MATNSKPLKFTPRGWITWPAASTNWLPRTRIDRPPTAAPEEDDDAEPLEDELLEPPPDELDEPEELPDELPEPLEEEARPPELDELLEPLPEEPDELEEPPDVPPELPEEEDRPPELDELLEEPPPEDEPGLDEPPPDEEEELLPEPDELLEELPLEEEPDPGGLEPLLEPGLLVPEPPEPDCRTSGEGLPELPQAASAIDSNSAPQRINIPFDKAPLHRRHRSGQTKGPSAPRSCRLPDSTLFHHGAPRFLRTLLQEAHAPEVLAANLQAR